MKPFSEKSWHFSPPLKSFIFGLVTHYNETILWEILAFLTTFKLSHFWVGYPLQWNHSIWNYFEKFSHFSPPPNFFIWAGRPSQQDHFEKSLYFSTLWKISAFFTISKNLHVFRLGRSPITTRSLWKISVFFTTLKNLCVFHLDRSPITTRPLWKISTFFNTLKNLCIFHHFEISSCFPPGQVAHYNKTTLKKSLYFSPLWKIFVFST